MSLQTQLLIKGLTLRVYLGWPSEERAEPQSVSVDVEIMFSTPPLACETDQLADTFCYAQLAERMRNDTQSTTFHLIEHLAWHLYEVAKQEGTLRHAKVMIQITKYPPIEGLQGGVAFRFGDR